MAPGAERRRPSWPAVVAILALLVPAVSAGAESPAGPRLAFLKFTERPDALLVATGDAALRAPAAVAGGGRRARPLPYPLSGPSWSADGSLIAFSGMMGPLPEILRPRRRQIYIATPDGAELRPVPGTRGGFEPVFSLDGQSIAFARTARRIHRSRRGLLARTYWKSTAVWSVGLDGSGLTRLTEWENGVENIPSSFSPDGSLLGLTHRDAFRDRADALALRLDDGSSYVLSKDAAWPRYSPDGGRIAFLGISRVGTTTCCELGDGFFVDLYVMSADRSSRLQLTDTSLKAERPASWDPSGERLAYTTRSAPTESASGDLEAAVMQINADGSCPSRISALVPKVRGYHLSFHYPAWQPGPGREAGRIEC